MCLSVDAHAGSPSLALSLARALSYTRAHAHMQAARTGTPTPTHTHTHACEKMQTIPGYKTTYELVKPGSGPTVTKGATVTVHATGVVKETGKKFWQVAPKVARELVRTARAPGRGD